MGTGYMEGFGGCCVRPDPFVNGCVAKGSNESSKVDDGISFSWMIGEGVSGEMQVLDEGELLQNGKDPGLYIYLNGSREHCIVVPPHVGWI